MKSNTLKERARRSAPLALAGVLVLLATVGAGGTLLLANIEHPSTLAAGTPVPSSDPVIDVDGNAQLAAAADSGSGTAGDPFIIEIKNIDAGGTGSAIRIYNTDAHRRPARPAT